MDKSNANGWKSRKYKTSIIVGSDKNPTKFESGQVIINQKATEKNLDKLIKMNKDGLEGKSKPKVTNDATDGGLLIGKPHYDKNGKPLGGIPGKVDGVKLIETETAEFVLNKEASEKHWKELSKINTSTGGVPINPPNKFDDDPEYDYKKGGNVIEFNPNHLPSKSVMKFANEIREKYPKVWNLGGNIFGNEAFKNLMTVRKRGYWLDSEEWMYIKWRAYVARHIHDFRIAGVIAMLKWGDKVEKGFPYMKELVEKEVEKRYKKEIKESGGKLKLKYGGAITYKEKYNKEYGFEPKQSHSLEDISKTTGISVIGLQAIYNKGIGAYKTNPKSVRPSVKSKEQWAMARVYSAVMGGRAAKIDANELKMQTGGLMSSQPPTENQLFNQLVKHSCGDGGNTENCIDYIKNSQSIKNNGYYFHFKNLNIYVDSYSAKTPKIKSLVLITFNSGGQSNLKVSDTINSIELSSVLSSLLNVDLSIARIIVSEQMLNAKRYSSAILNEILNENIVVADRNIIVCSNLSTHEFKNGGSTDEMTQLKSEINKLYTKAFKMMPNSPRQKEVIKQIDELRIKLENMNGKFENGGSTDENTLIVKKYILSRHPKKDDIFKGGNVNKYKIVKIKKVKKHYGIIYQLLLLSIEKNKEGKFNRRIVNYNPENKKIGDFEQGYLTTTQGKFYISWDDSELNEKLEEGGSTENGAQKFIKWYINWFKGISNKMNIYFSLPNPITPFKEKNVVIMDLFEKIDQEIDSKQYLKEVINKADEYGVTIYLEPTPRHKYFLNDAEKRNKISKDYLISYYNNFSFELTPNKQFMKRLPKMKNGGLLPAQGTLTTSDKKYKLDYQKVGSDYQFVVYEGEPNPVKGYTKVTFKKRDKNVVTMNYNQFIKYLYDKGYINDLVEYADGGSTDSNKTGHYINGRELSFQELIKETEEDIKELESKEMTLRIHKLLESKYDRLKYYKLKAKIIELQEKQYNVRNNFDYNKLEKEINNLKKELRENYEHGGSTDAKDTATIDIPLLIRLLELSREDIHSDAELHQVVERLLDLKNKPVLTMDDYAYIADIEHKHVNQMAVGGTLDSDPQKLISQAHYNITVKKGRMEYAPTSHEIQEEIDRMVMEGQFGSNNI